MNKRCQVFTPPENVIELLDIIQYQGELYGKKVIENTCGDGQILMAIVERYIKSCLNQELNLNQIKFGLENDIYGAEINSSTYQECIDNLDQIAEKYGIYEVQWNIHNGDVLKYKFLCKFSYIIGNPPYITYRDLDNDLRKFLREKYTVCSVGKFDYCYAFIQEGINCLCENGKLAYLIPSSIFKNVYAQNLRDFMLPHLTNIYDYTTKKLFKELTSSAIMVVEKGRNTNEVIYHDIVKKNTYTINKNKLINKWSFNKISVCEKEKIRFGDYFHASVSVATLYNEAFVIKNYKEDRKYILVKNIAIEREILRKAVSPRSLNYNRSELIIFPYYYTRNGLKRYGEKEFIEKYPNASKYLRKFIEKLDKRKSDKSVKWFEYGRSQAIAHLNQKKLLISTIITDKVKVYELSKDCIPYSGIYIIKKGELSLSDAKKIMESQSFMDYIISIGIRANGRSIRITSKDINDYEFVR